jgi:hypothetical protein
VTARPLGRARTRMQISVGGEAIEFRRSVELPRPGHGPGSLSGTTGSKFIFKSVPTEELPEVLTDAGLTRPGGRGPRALPTSLSQEGLLWRFRGFCLSWNNKTRYVSCSATVDAVKPPTFNTLVLQRNAVHQLYAPILVGRCWLFPPHPSKLMPVPPLRSIAHVSCKYQLIEWQLLKLLVMRS